MSLSSLMQRLYSLYLRLWSRPPQRWSSKYEVTGDKYGKIIHLDPKAPDWYKQQVLREQSDMHDLVATVSTSQESNDSQVTRLTGGSVLRHRTSMPPPSGHSTTWGSSQESGPMVTLKYATRTTRGERIVFREAPSEVLSEVPRIDFLHPKS